MEATSTQILSDVVHHIKYARWLPEEKRKETWDETVFRNYLMHVERFKDHSNSEEIVDLLNWAYKFVYDKKVVPSMRAMQFSGKPILVNPARNFNCAFVKAVDIRVFSEIFFLLLSGCGVGYSVQRHHVEELPLILGPRKVPGTEKYKTRRHLIPDDIEGWAESLFVLLRAYTENKSKPKFDFSAIRPKGAWLKTSGGKAPGPYPLKIALLKIESILEGATGRYLTPLECHDILCHTADAVLAGGIRRSAMICLFSFDDEEMLSCKSGMWWQNNPQRGRANNSAVCLRHRVTREDFDDFWNRIEKNNTGEPAIVFSNSREWGFNPCVEASLRSGQFCNLTSINGLLVSSQQDLIDYVKAATIIGTFQASYTDFHYLREFWRETTEKDALIGVSITGIASGTLKGLNLSEAARYSKEVNAKVAKLLGINQAARTTLIKPEGSTSLIFGTSSGIHDWYAPYYLRRVTILKTDPIYFYLRDKLPELVEDNVLKPDLEAFIKVPMQAPKDAVYHESAVDFLDTIFHYTQNWVHPGHRSGDNTHNVSATVYIEDHEWREVGEKVWGARNIVSGLSFFPYDGGTYNQAPHERITEKQFKEMQSLLRSLDLKDVKHTEDNTTFSVSPACAGGACEA